MFRSLSRFSFPVKGKTNSFILILIAFLLVPGMAQAEDVFSLVGQENGNLDRLDITTGTYTVLSLSGSVYDGLAFNANETVLYGVISASVSSSSLSQLVTINPNTGIYTLVGNDGVALTTLSSTADGRLFGVGYDDKLYQINPNTGSATLIGSTGLPALTGNFDNSLASNGTLLYYTLGTNGSKSSLYTLDLTTGTAKLIGSTGTSDIAGSVFAGPTFATGQLYGFSSTGSTDVINLSTGTATLLNNNGLANVFGGVGIVTAAAVPEPGSLALLTGTAFFGGSLLLRRYRRK